MEAVPQVWGGLSFLLIIIKTNQQALELLPPHLQVLSWDLWPSGTSFPSPPSVPSIYMEERSFIVIPAVFIVRVLDRSSVGPMFLLFKEPPLSV